MGLCGTRSTNNGEEAQPVGLRAVLPMVVLQGVKCSGWRQSGGTRV